MTLIEWIIVLLLIAILGGAWAATPHGVCAPVSSLYWSVRTVTSLLWIG